MSRKFLITSLALAIILVAVPVFAAVSTSSLHDNASPGVGLIIPQSVSLTDSTCKYPLGTRKEYSDGRVYRYAHFGEDTNRGLIVAQDNSESASLSAGGALVVVASTSSDNTTDGLGGSKYVEITASSITAGQFDGGYLCVMDHQGEGHVYRIKHNTATDDPASGNFRVQLYDELIEPVNATSTVAIIGPKYGNLESSDTTDEIPVGVVVSTMDVSEAAYGWVQTRGVSTVLQDSSGGAFTIGCTVTLSDGTAGACQVMDAYTEPIVGTVIDFGTQNGCHAVIDLKIE